MDSIKNRLTLVEPNQNSQNVFSPSGKKNYSVLVLNANRQMANEITTRLAERVEDCSIVYAPTLELAKLLLKKGTIDLVVSSPILPDGHITKLQPLLESLSNPPDVLIFADIEKKSIRLFESANYHFLSIRQVNSQTNDLVIDKTKEENPISLLSADIRDQLNNPLQEIVSLIFVARSASTSLSTAHALDAIESAAQNMATMVWGLEERLYENMVAHEQTVLRRRAK